MSENKPRNLQPLIHLIKNFEGCVLHAYRDGGGVLTIGWGTTSGVYEGMVITQEQADQLFMDDLMKRFVPGVERLVKVPLNDNQFCALVDFAYNCGVGALGASTLLRELNSNCPPEVVAKEFGRWVHDEHGNIEPGLVRRRQFDHDLFLA